LEAASWRERFRHSFAARETARRGKAKGGAEG
jgi:hypothetical protein